MPVYWLKFLHFLERKPIILFLLCHKDSLKQCRYGFRQMICRPKQTVTTKRWKLTDRGYSIKARLAKAKEQSKQPTVAEEKQFEACVLIRMNFARTLVKKDMHQQSGRH